MRFAHIADCHLGGWRDPKIRQLNLQSFHKAIEICGKNKVDFLLIAGDLFNTSLPPIDILKQVVIELKQLKDKNIPVYAIAGSHDFSPSGKTMLDVLENAALLTNVSKGSPVEGKLRLEFTQDPKTGIKLTGIPGRKGMLDASYYEALDREHAKATPGPKIFLFHSAISEYKPKGFEQMQAMALSYLPEGFEYYAGGHVHEPLLTQAKGWVVMPGPLFPNNFAELEKLEYGSMVICTVEDNKFNPELLKIPLIDVVKLNLQCNGLSSEAVSQQLIEAIKSEDTHNKLVLIRLEGTLGFGRVTDIDFHTAYKHAGTAYQIMRNTAQLRSREFESIKVSAGSVEEVEQKIIQEHGSDMELFKDKEKQVVMELLNLLSKERGEGETKAAYEDRIASDFDEHVK